LPNEIRERRIGRCACMGVRTRAAEQRRERGCHVTKCQDLRHRRDGMNTPVISYKRHRLAPQIIAHAVWLYYRFPLSLRLIDELLLERGIVVSYETIRRWAKKFGPDYARRTTPADCDASRRAAMISGKSSSSSPPGQVREGACPKAGLVLCWPR
jgi:hypothetical protein